MLSEILAGCGTFNRAGIWADYADYRDSRALRNVQRVEQFVQWPIRDMVK